jgi:pyrroline-5-carboxylate reductase
LEDGGARGVVSKAIRAATVVASKLGQGVKNVNGANV